MRDNEACDRFIEQMGQITEEEGLPRIAGRIFGLLILSPGELNLDEIAEKLSVSRASVSTDARRLADCGLLQRVTRRGDRKDYYQVTPDHFSYMLERRMLALQRMAAVFSVGLELSGLPPEIDERLKNSSSIINWFMARAVQDLAEFRSEFSKIGKG